MLPLEDVLPSLPQSIRCGDLAIELAHDAVAHQRYVGDLDRSIVNGTWRRGRHTGIAAVALYPYSWYRTSIAVELSGAPSDVSLREVSETFRDAVLAMASTAPVPTRAPVPARAPVLVPARPPLRAVSARRIAGVAIALVMVLLAACGGSSTAPREQSAATSSETAISAPESSSPDAEEAVTTSVPGAAPEATVVRDRRRERNWTTARRERNWTTASGQRPRQRSAPTGELRVPHLWYAGGRDAAPRRGPLHYNSCHLSGRNDTRGRR